MPENKKVLIQGYVDSDLVDKAKKIARNKINLGWNVKTSDLIRMALSDFVKNN